MKFIFVIVLIVLSAISCNTDQHGTKKGIAGIDTVKINSSKTFQTIVGFGGFGPQHTWYSKPVGHYFSPQFINDIINKLGVTIIRDKIPVRFEYAKGKFSVDSSATYPQSCITGGSFSVLESSKKSWVKQNNCIGF